MGENTQRDKVKHSLKLISAKYKTKGGKYTKHMCHMNAELTQRLGLTIHC